MTSNHSARTILTFIFGAAAGAVAALLLAPKAGAELRGDIAAGASHGVKKARGTVEDLKRRAQKVVTLAQEEVDDAIETGQNAYNQAK